jgi:4-aminobutyrate aminotransferase/(S)-3-amino-2-methylpropionate transaminase
MVTNKQLLERRNKAVVRGSVNTVPIFPVKAFGARITDVEGNVYIDFTGGIAVVGVAHNHPKIVQAAKDQLDKFVHVCWNVMPYEGYIRLAEELNTRAPGVNLKKTFLCNSGAEAVENAVKLARFHTGRDAIICFDGAFHGRTMLGLTLTSKVRPLKVGFGPFMPEVYRAPFPYCYRCPFGQTDCESCGLECVDHLEKMFITTVDPDSVAAIIFEPVQGEGGFVPAPKAFLQKLSEICKKRGILLIADEVQTGFGRTGAIFASEVYGIEPDIIAVAKSLANGLPLSAVIGNAEIMDGPPAGGLGGTFAGNPVACAAALATLEVIDEEKICDRALKVGRVIRERFESFSEKFDIVGDVRGLGAMMAMELVSDRSSKAPAKEQTSALTAYALARGLLVLTAGPLGNVIRLLPPLLIDDEDLIRGLDILEEGLTQVCS